MPQNKVLCVGCCCRRCRYCYLCVGKRHTAGIIQYVYILYDWSAQMDMPIRFHACALLHLPDGVCACVFGWISSLFAHIHLCLAMPEWWYGTKFGKQNAMVSCRMPDITYTYASYVWFVLYLCSKNFSSEVEPQGKNKVGFVYWFVRFHCFFLLLYFFFFLPSPHRSSSLLLFAYILYRFSIVKRKCGCCCCLAFAATTTTTKSHTVRRQMERMALFLHFARSFVR